MKKLLMILAVLGLAVSFAQSDTFVTQSLAGGPVSLDPARAYDTASGGILQNVYETLYTYDGESIDQFVPALATDYNVSEDGMMYTFTLREGVVFHDGTPFNAEEAKFYFDWATDADNPYGSGQLGSKYQGQVGPRPSRYWENFDR